MKAICTSALTKKYKGQTAVDSVNLSVEEGEIFALLGINGAGKTTILKMLTCLTSPTDGDALIFGKSIRQNPLAVKELISISPQETAIAPNLTVLENLRLICGIYSLPKNETELRIEQLTNLLGLSTVLLRKAGKLSGGFMRRVSIAMALICMPKILFLDEPTLGLDVIARSELWEVIHSLRGKTTVILTTHYMEEAEELSDRIGIMKDGKLLAVGTTGELKALCGKDTLEAAFISIVKGELK